MELKPLILEGTFELKLDFSEDDRGDFVKTFHADIFQSNNLDADFKESYYSTSNAGVIRGMHFQLPPHDHSKLVYCVAGSVLDVLLDLRNNSPTYGEHCTVDLSKQNHNAVYIPKGVAHGFCVQEGAATLVYLTTTVYNSESDTGVLWSSFGFDWPIDNPVISDRDQGFSTLEDFINPFK